MKITYNLSLENDGNNMTVINKEDEIKMQTYADMSNANRVTVLDFLLDAQRSLMDFYQQQLAKQSGGKNEPQSKDATS